MLAQGRDYVQLKTRSVVLESNNTTAFLRRNLSSCPVNIRTKCYTTFVRPQLQYASSVWATHTQSNINKLESVQRRAARFATGNYNTINTLSIWLFHDKFWLMVIPIYFPLDVMFNSFPWMKYDDGMILRLVVMRITSHLSGLKCICQSRPL
jgi:hypothetical protein